MANLKLCGNKISNVHFPITVHSDDKNSLCVCHGRTPHSIVFYPRPHVNKTFLHKYIIAFDDPTCVRGRRLMLIFPTCMIQSWECSWRLNCYVLRLRCKSCGGKKLNTIYVVCLLLDLFNKFKMDEQLLNVNTYKS